MPVNESFCKKRLYYFILIQLLFWTMIPWLCRHNMPFDTIEGIAWGNQWQLGYDKHPPLAAWLCALFSKAGTAFPVYLLAQLAVCAAYYATWRITRQILSPALALVSVLILASIWYYTIATSKINPNTLMTPVWMLSALAFYAAYNKGTTTSWLMAGLMAGICMLTKYESVVFLVPMFGFLFVTEKGRSYLCSKEPYLAMVIFLLVWSPNLYWNSQHQWSEILYAHGRGGDYQAISQGISSHFYWPLKFLLQQILSLAFAIILLALCFFLPKERSHLEKDDLTFLGFAALGPVVLTLIISLTFGVYLYAKWATPYFSLLPAFILALRQPKLSKKWVNAMFVVGIFFIVASSMARGAYLLFGPQLTHKAHPDAYFPGQAIADRVASLWQQKQKSPLPVIAGDHYLVANIAVYDPNHPAPYMGLSSHQSPWLNDQKVKQLGAMFAWYDPFHQGLSRTIQNRFPSAQFLGDYYFSKATTAPVHTPGFTIALAYLAPTDQVH